MRVSKNDVRSSRHSIPRICFEAQDLTSFGGSVLFQALFKSVNFKARLTHCTRHVRSSSSYGLHNILATLVVHVLLGWRRLSDVAYYRDDPMIKRLLGLKIIPPVCTLSRGLRMMTAGVVERLRKLVLSLVLERVAASGMKRLTVDFDGSVLSTKSRCTEGTAVGYNPKAKGARSYYPLFATLAQTGQVLDVLHRPGNVHDSKEAMEFVDATFSAIRESGFRGVLEARLDGAHFSDFACYWLDHLGVDFSVSVPFERFPELKQKIESRKRWRTIDDDWAFFEQDWRPKSWGDLQFRCIIYRHRLPVPRKGPIQLDLFIPIDWQYEYKAVMTNKAEGAGAVLAFHNGRGSQEGIFAELKSQANMDYIPTRRRIGNQVFLLCTALAHNLNRELQMRVRPRRGRNTKKRACLWAFDKIGTFRHRLIQRAARLTRPSGALTLHLSANRAAADEIKGYLDELNAA